MDVVYEEHHHAASGPYDLYLGIFCFVKKKLTWCRMVQKYVWTIFLAKFILAKPHFDNFCQWNFHIFTFFTMEFFYETCIIVKIFCSSFANDSQLSVGRSFSKFHLFNHMQLQMISWLLESGKYSEKCTFYYFWTLMPRCITIKMVLNGKGSRKSGNNGQFILLRDC